MLDPDDEKIIRECQEAGATFITWDRVLREAAHGITPFEALDLAGAEADKQHNEAAKAEMAKLRSLSPQNLTALGEQADSTVLCFQRQIVLNLGGAKLVRDMRVEEDYSWRAIARAVALLSKGDWGGNQLAGMVICQKAADLLGQDFMAPPWN